MSNKTGRRLEGQTQLEAAKEQWNNIKRDKRKMRNVRNNARGKLHLYG